MTPYRAYRYAYNHHDDPEFDLKYYQKIACKDSECAYWFAKNIPEANIAYCQLHACKKATVAYSFASHVQGANLDYCRNACKHSSVLLNEFDKMIAKKALL